MTDLCVAAVAQSVVFFVEISISRACDRTPIGSRWRSQCDVNLYQRTGWVSQAINWQSDIKRASASWSGLGSAAVPTFGGGRVSCTSVYSE